MIQLHTHLIVREREMFWGCTVSSYLLLISILMLTILDNVPEID